MKKTLIYSFAVLIAIAVKPAGYAQAQTATDSTTVAPPPAFCYNHVALPNDTITYQSQVMLRDANGMIRTLPAFQSDYTVCTPGVATGTVYANTMVAYDYKNPLPAIQAMGGNYAFFQGNELATISSIGMFFPKFVKTYSPDVLGGVYFTKKGTSELVVVDSNGFVFDNTGIIASNIRLAGGNYFIDQNGILTTIRAASSIDAAGNYSSLGMVTKMDQVIITNGTTTNVNVAVTNKLGKKTTKVEEKVVAPVYANFSTARTAGGNFFVNGDGTVITISAVTGFFSSPYTPDAPPAVVGGNWYIGTDGVLYTVTNDGLLMKNDPVKTPASYGYSYLQYADGSFLFVDAKGNPHSTVVEVSTNGQILTPMAALPALENNSTFLPTR